MLKKQKKSSKYEIPKAINTVENLTPHIELTFFFFFFFSQTRHQKAWFTTNLIK